MVMTHLMTGKVMTGQEFIDLADPQEKMRRLNPHARIGFMFPGFALGALLAVAAWVVYFGVSSLLFASTHCSPEILCSSFQKGPFVFSQSIRK